MIKRLIKKFLTPIIEEAVYTKSQGVAKVELSRVDLIRLKLKRGDKKRIAQTIGVYPEWVSRVIRGEGVSEPILQAAEQLIREREQTN